MTAPLRRLCSWCLGPIPGHRPRARTCSALCSAHERHARAEGLARPVFEEAA